MRLWFVDVDDPLRRGGGGHVVELALHVSLCRFEAGAVVSGRGGSAIRRVAA